MFFGEGCEPLRDAFPIGAVDEEFAAWSEIAGAVLRACGARDLKEVRAFGDCLVVVEVADTACRGENIVIDLDIELCRKGLEAAVELVSVETGVGHDEDDCRS